MNHAEVAPAVRKVDIDRARPVARTQDTVFPRQRRGCSLRALGVQLILTRVLIDILSVDGDGRRVLAPGRAGQSPRRDWDRAQTVGGPSNGNAREGHGARLRLGIGAHEQRAQAPPLRGGPLSHVGEGIGVDGYGVQSAHVCTHDCVIQIDEHPREADQHK
eukprot:scaffold103776_cov27-Tisochrysis_lutea.AAC.4